MIIYFDETASSKKGMILMNNGAVWYIALDWPFRFIVTSPPAHTRPLPSTRSLPLPHPAPPSYPRLPVVLVFRVVVATGLLVGAVLAVHPTVGRQLPSDVGDPLPTTPHVYNRCQHRSTLTIIICFLCTRVQSYTECSRAAETV